MRHPDLTEAENRRLAELQAAFVACGCELIRPPAGDYRRPFYVYFFGSTRVMGSLDEVEQFLPMVGGRA